MDRAFKEEYVCLGFKTIELVIDGQLVKCYGYAYKTGKCLGYNNESELVELPCRQWVTFLSSAPQRISWNPPASLIQNIQQIPLLQSMPLF